MEAVRSHAGPRVGSECLGSGVQGSLFLFCKGGRVRGSVCDDSGSWFVS